MKLIASSIASLVLSTLTVHVNAQSSVSDVLQGEDFSTLLTALTTTGLDSTLVGGGPFTIFAPNNDAFAALQAASPGTLEGWLAESPPDTLTSVLLHHVADGVVDSSMLFDGLVIEMLSMENATLMAGPPAMIDDSTIVQADVAIQEGIIHVIDFPIVPSTVDVLPGIFETANATGRFNILLSLIESVGLADQLNTPGPFTVFAPTDEAFGKIEDLDAIASDPTAVIAILTNHVVGGKITSDMLSDGSRLGALGGQSLMVSTNGGQIMINDAGITQVDILGSNGVVHAIDTVLLSSSTTPDDGSPTQAPVAMGNPTSFGGGNGGFLATGMPTSAAGAVAFSKVAMLFLVAIVLV